MSATTSTLSSSSSSAAVRRSWRCGFSLRSTRRTRREGRRRYGAGRGTARRRACGALEPDPGGETVSGEAARDAGQQLECLVALTAVVEDPGERDSSVGPAGFELNGAPALVAFAAIAIYFVVFSKFLGGTVWQRVLGVR